MIKWGGAVVDFVTGVLTRLLSTEEEIDETDLSDRVDRVELDRWTMVKGRSNFCVSNASMLTSDRGWVAGVYMESAMSDESGV